MSPQRHPLQNLCALPLPTALSSLPSAVARWASRKQALGTYRGWWGGGAGSPEAIPYPSLAFGHT